MTVSNHTVGNDLEGDVMAHQPSTTIATAPAQRSPGSGAPARCEVHELVRRTCELLASRVPLTLLMDLGEPAGPRSHERYLAEGGDPSLFAPVRLARAG